MLVDMKFLEFKNIDLPIENEKMIILKLHSNQECMTSRNTRRITEI